MSIYVERTLPSSTGDDEEQSDDQSWRLSFALDLDESVSQQSVGESQPGNLVHLGTILESEVRDLPARVRLWEAAEQILFDLGFQIGTERGEQVRALLAIYVNPPGPADTEPTRLEDAQDDAFLDLVKRAQEGGDDLWRDAHETTGRLAAEHGDDVRLAHVLKYRSVFPAELRDSLLLEAWKESRHPSSFEIQEIVAALREIGPSAFEGNPPPDRPMRVYRTVGPGGLVRGMAWTTEIPELSIFVRRVFLGQTTEPKRHARIYTTMIDPDCVLATFEFEREIVVDPDCLSDVQLLRLVEPDQELLETV